MTDEVKEKPKCKNGCDRPVHDNSFSMPKELDGLCLDCMYEAFYRGDMPHMPAHY